MDLHQLRVFVSVFRNKSFSRASEELSLTQPTVSDHIKTLEEDLGCRLFDRLGRSIVATAEAEVLYVHSSELLEKAAAIKDALSQLKEELSGEVLVGASTIPGTYILPPVMGAFRKQHPALTFRILIADTRGITEGVLRHDLLLGVVGARQRDEQLLFRPIMEDHLTVISSPALVRERALSLAELLSYPFVLREQGSGTRREIERILEQHGLGPDEMRVACVFGSNEAVKQAVKAGLGVSILSRLSVLDDLKHASLKEVPLSDAGLTRKFYIVSHRRRTLPPAYSLFAEHIIGALKISSP